MPNQPNLVLSQQTVSYTAQPQAVTNVGGGLKFLSDGGCSVLQRRTLSLDSRPCFVQVSVLLVGMLLGLGTLAQTPNNTEVVRLRILGGLDGVTQYTKHEQPFWTKTLAARSAGRIQAEISPIDRAGIRVQESLRFIQLGVVPFGTSLLGQGGFAPELAAMDLAGLNPDISSVRRSLAAFRPTLESTLRERYGVELLAVYAYPAQVIYCRNAFAGLSDLKGRKVRTASSSQADLIEALGAVPVVTSFAELMPYVRSGTIDCAITGTMSGNTIGLHEITSHLHTLPLNWGLSVFAANGAAWNGLPADVRALIKEELPKLEAAIWADAERETKEGIACNTGQPSGCSGARRGKMVPVPMTAQDEQLRRDVFSNSVLTRWIQRCGALCARTWEQSLGPATGINPKTN